MVSHHILLCLQLFRPQRFFKRNLTLQFGQFEENEFLTGAGARRREQADV